MRKLSIFIFCLLFTACAGNRTLDGETTKNWVKIVSSRLDNSGNAQDVCYLLDLSFYPGTVYERLKNNPKTCLEECCWYSENKTVYFYFNDGFIKELDENGVSRRYYPDNIKINLNYSPFLNRLSAKASSSEGISKDGIVTLEYEDIYRPETEHGEIGNMQPKIYPESNKDTQQDTKKESSYYKQASMSGLNRQELLTKAENERDEYYFQAIEERYESPEKEFVKESITFKGQVSPFSKEDKETKWLSKKPLTQEDKTKQKEFVEYKNKVKKEKKNIKQQKVNIENKAQDTMYDIQRTYSQESKIVYVEPIMPEKVDANTLKQKLSYERAEAVKLLKRFYGDEIDEYLHTLDTSKRQQGQILFTNNKVWQTSKIGTPIYQIDCKVNGKIALLGTKEGTETTDYPLTCGTYIVNLDEKTVEAKDKIARKIAKKTY